MIGPEQHANTEAFKQWALAEARPDAEWVITRKDARELVALAERAATLERDQQRWLAWSGGDYPDDSPGDVVSADADGTIVLDDGITTWEPKRAAAWFKARADTLERERDAARGELEGENYILRSTHDAISGRLYSEAQQARAEAERLREALKWYAERRNYREAVPGKRRSEWMETQDSFDGEGPGARARAALSAGEGTPA